MKPKHNWQLIKQTFVTGDKTTLKALASRFNVPYQSVRRKAAKEDWHGCRLSYRYKGFF